MGNVPKKQAMYESMAKNAGVDIIACVFSWCYACEYEHAAAVINVPCELIYVRIKLVVVQTTESYS